MKEIILLPLVGAEIQGIGQVLFGQSSDEVEKILGVPSTKYLSYIKNGLTLFYNPAYTRVTHLYRQSES